MPFISFISRSGGLTDTFLFLIFVWIMRRPGSTSSPMRHGLDRICRPSINISRLGRLFGYSLFILKRHLKIAFTILQLQIAVIHFSSLNTCCITAPMYVFAVCLNWKCRDIGDLLGHCCSEYSSLIVYGEDRSLLFFKVYFGRLSVDPLCTICLFIVLTSWRL